MKVKNSIVCALVFGLCFVVVSSASAFSLFNRDVSKAKKFMKAGMYPQAIAVLEKRINDEPDDAEAHFLLGKCYILTGNLSGADARFKSAVRLDADYGFKIGGEYRRAGSEALARGDVDRALRLFGKAAGYQPGLRKEIAEECYREGMARLNLSLLQAASFYDPALKQRIARECFEKGKSIVEAKAGKKDAALERGEARRIRRYLGIAYRIDPSYTGQCRKVLLDASMIKGDANEQLMLLRAAIRLGNGGQEKELTRVVKALGKEFKKHKVKRRSVKNELERLPKKYRTMFANVAWPPDYKVYRPGDVFYFKGKAGEYSNHWINPVPGTYSEFQVKDGKFEIVTRSGRRFKMGKYPSELKEDYKVFAVTDCDMRILFKPAK